MLPECLSGPNGTNVTTFYGNNLILPSFDAIPASTVTLSLRNGVLSPVSPHSPSGTDGYDDIDGSIAWDEVFTLFPNMTSFSLYLAKQFHGTLPASIPSRLTSFVLSECNITGTIPSTFFSDFSTTETISTFDVNLNYLQITGGLPSGFFNALAGMAVEESFSFTLSSNRLLTGTVPENFLDPLEAMHTKTFFMRFYDNRLSGTLPSSFSFPAGLMNPTYNLNSFTLDINYNSFTGSLPAALFAFPLYVNTFSVSFSDSTFNGSLPNSFLNQVVWTGNPCWASLSFYRNEFTGTIPADLFSSSLKQNTNFTYLGIDLSINELEGSIPETLLYSINNLKKDIDSNTNAERALQSTKQISQRDSATALSSTDTAATVLYTASVLNMLVVSAFTNKLNGTLDRDFLAYSSTSSMTSVRLDFHNNQLQGPLPTPLLYPLPDVSTLRVVLDFSENQIAASIPPYCFSLATLELDVNTNLLDGTIYGVSSCNVLSINIARNPLIDLCSSNISFESFTGSCDLSFTDACNCLDSYTMCTTTCPVPAAPVEPVTPPPTSPPTAAIPPSSPTPTSTTSPSSASSPSPPQCTSVRPSADFSCVNGVWIATSTNVTILTIPAKAGSIVVTGNVSSSSIVFQGVIGTTITIDGCANNLTTVVIELTQEEILKIEKSGVKSLLLLTQSNSSSCNNLNYVALKSNVDHGCRKIATDKIVTNNGNTLSVALSVDMGGCNRWWIILVSVVVVVVILGAVAAAIGVVLWKRHQSKKQKRSLSSMQRPLRG